MWRNRKKGIGCKVIQNDDLGRGRGRREGRGKGRKDIKAEEKLGNVSKGKSKCKYKARKTVTDSIKRYEMNTHIKMSKKRQTSAYF